MLDQGIGPCTGDNIFDGGQGNIFSVMPYALYESTALGGMQIGASTILSDAVRIMYTVLLKVVLLSCM